MILRMDAYLYMNTHSYERVQQVCDLAGTKPSWFSLCARGHGEFSMKIAIDLEAASRLLADLNDDYMTVEEIFGIEAQVKDRVDIMRQKMIEAAKAA